ncbi:MAG: hypothetical protein ACTSRZ_16475 [Promethearchaeota archaeon]
MHTKDESGKDRKNKRSGRRKSKIRAKIEALFGIETKNFNFERLYVRSIINVRKDICLKCIRWNIYIVI